MARGKNSKPKDYTIPLEFAKRVTISANESYRSGEMLTKVTPTTRELLTVWFDREWTQDRGDLNFHEGQKQAILNTIYLHEVLGTQTILDAYEAIYPEALLESNLVPEFDKKRFSFPKYAIKMATGTGKTWVMQALLIWQYLNARNAEPGTYSKNFLIIAPGIIVYERLLDAFAGKQREDGTRDFESSDINMYGELFIPEQYTDVVLNYIRNAVKNKDTIGSGVSGDGIIAVTNWHALMLEEEEIAETDAIIAPGDALDADRVLKDVLPVRPGKSTGNDLSVLDRSVEIGREIEFLKSLPDLVVFNDEAHRVREETQWEKSLLEIAVGHDKFSQIDFTATPYEQDGEAKKYFPHIIVDFDLKTAIKKGLVKLLAIDSRKEIATTELDYRAKRSPDGTVIDISDGQRLMLRAGYKKLRLLEDQFTAIDSTKYPKMLVVCEDTEVVPKVMEFLKSEGFLDDDILEVHTGRKGDVTADEWEAIKRRLFSIDHHERPRIIISVLMLREGFDVSNICVIVPLRSAGAPILLEQVVGRGLRLMWREPEYKEAHRDNIQALTEHHTEPPSYIDILSVVEHPKFRDFYNDLLEDGLAFADERDGLNRDEVLGGYVTIGLRDDYAKYDFQWPTIIAEPEETLADFKPDPSVVPPFVGLSLAQLQKHVPDRETFHSEEITGRTRFGDYAVQSGVLLSESYNEFLQRLVQRVMTVLAEKLEARRTAIATKFPVLQVRQHLLAEFTDSYIRTRLFNEPFTPDSTPSSWRVLLVQPVVMHLINHLSAVVLKYHEAKVSGSHDISWRSLSSVDSIRGREKYLIDAPKTIYTQTPYPSNKCDFEKQFIEFIYPDAKVASFVKLIPSRHTFISFKYQSENGNFAPYFPDFLVRVADTIYIVETKADRDAWGDLEVKNKKIAALSWCERMNGLPAETRRNISWRYVLVSEATFHEFKNKGMDAREMLEFCSVYREGGAKQEALFR